MAEPLLQAVSICIHQLQSQTAQQRELQDSEQLRDQNVAGWIGSIGRSETSAGNILEAGLLEKSQSREVEYELEKDESELNGYEGDEGLHVESAEASLHLQKLNLTPAMARDLKVGMWNFDAIQTASEHGSVLKIVGMELVGKASFISRSCLAPFLDAMEERYLVNPYHSSAHAADAANSFQVLASSSGLLHCSSSPLPALRSVSMCVAALGHDLGHPGLNNSFQINSRDALAVTYNDRSVLENFHAAELERLLSRRYGPRQTKLMAIPQNHEARERQVRISMILSTDLSKHMQDLGDLRLRLGSGDFDPLEVNADQQLALTWYFRASDIGHSAKPWDIHRRWSERLVEEFHAQGDVEKGLGLPLSPLCDRHNFDLSKSQTGFLQFVCIPMFEELGRLDDLLESGCELNKQRKKPVTSVSLHLSRHDMKVVPWEDVVPSVELKVESRLSRSFTGGVPPEVDKHHLPGRVTIRIAQKLLLQCKDNMNSWKNYVDDF
ncbi:PDE1A [Symbiodinium natans]|uniref:Phosphodiesterase n=1 Tax=Symbiodinium natans TaxID=878477 RepID=A0A812QZZ4_9DINO|nr:PDE1A [Symbiodinium natans]